MSTATMTRKPKRSVWDGGNEPLKASWGKLMMWFFLLSDAFTFSAFLIVYGMVRWTYPAFEAGVSEYPIVQNPSNASETALAVDPDNHSEVTTFSVNGQQVEGQVVYDGSEMQTQAVEQFVMSDQWWPIPEQVYAAIPFVEGYFPLVFVGIMTFILILSSVTMVLAVEAGHRMDQKDVEKWMLWTIVGGATFLGCQAWEWAHFIHGHGFTMLTTGEYAGQYFQGANLNANQYGPAQFAQFFFFITGFHGTHVLSGVIINIAIYYQTIMGTYQRRGHYEMVEKVGLYWHFVDLVWVFVFTFFYLV